MIGALLLLIELLVMAWLIWCLVRNPVNGKPRDLDLMQYSEERYVKPVKVAGTSKSGKAP
ncbi:MAG: hypothetical protein IV093_00535 [Rubrivivax sp.]|nr:hypothetical protein [Rubrivivax sp.]